MRLFRAVCHEELKDIRDRGRLRVGENSLEGKWLAEREDDARRWADEFERRDGKPCTVIEVVVPPDVFAGAFSVEHLDDIGPAIFVEEHDLAALVPRT